MFPCTNLSVALLFFGLIYQNYAKMIVNVRIYDYSNLNNVRHDGKQCENFPWMKDHCDPIFHICVTAINRCDILSKSTNVWANKKSLFTVLMRDIPVRKFPKSISIRVQVDDHDQFGTHDHIAIFRSNFEINTLNFIHRKTMNVEPSGLNVRLQSSVTVKCAKNYYGPTCDERLDHYTCAESCRHGQCVLNEKDKYYCKCQSGWSGEVCNQFETNNCTLLNCTQVCNIAGRLKNCICVKNEPDIQKCSEEYLPSTVRADFPKSTQSSKASTKSTLVVIETKPNNRIIITTSEKSQIENKTESNQNSDTQLPINPTPKGRRNPPEDNPAKSHLTPSTIIIICLLLLLCICIIGLFVIVQNWKRKTNSKLTHVSTLQRPLPPILYEKNLSTKNSIYNSTAIRKTNLESESCRIPFRYNGLDSGKSLHDKYRVEPFDIYEEPIINNMESLTCETEANDSDYSDTSTYEKPIKRMF